MRQYIILLFGFLLLASCTNHIETNITPSEDCLILNACLESQNKVHKVFLSYKKGGQIEAVADYAKMYASVNGAAKVELTRLANDKISSAFELEHTFQPGDKLALYAECGSMAAMSQVEFPAALGTETELTYEDLTSNFNPYFRIKFSFYDDAATTDYYKFSVKNSYALVGTNLATSQTIRKDYSRFCICYSSNALISTGNLPTHDFMEEIMRTFVPSNSNMVFNDDGISGQKVVLDADAIPLENVEFDEDLKDMRVDMVDRSIDVHIQHISQDTYRYFRSLDAGESFGFAGNILVEPTIIPSNVSGGSGFVAAITSTTRKITFPDIENYYGGIY